ncbi:MAG: 16S rRNA (guanine(966)-N(2))-methyltransferase RsmD [Legionellales bacterium]|nr:16S rRNA (guanine(966)-N(2))-methyltransferase RsmD [Legionellales bacterium]
MARKFGKLRIIAGEWRGRQFEVIAQPDLRPTPDKIRETLFNWLQHVIAGACCLDLFAGTGALGLEALSRGASHVTFIDNSPVAAKQLKQVLEGWNATERSTVHLYDVRHKLAVPPRPYDIVFLDPPFGFGYLQAMCDVFIQPGWLNPNAYIYMESESTLRELKLPDNWELIKQKISGNVCYRLLRACQAASE